jgi:hypothetical protein
VAAVFLAASLVAACSPRSFSVGSVPFPAPKPVFVDNTGQAIAGLPESPEAWRLVLLDFTWCPPCADVWRAIREASRGIPEGSVHVYRVLFDRERLLRREGTVETAPMRPTPPPDAGTFPVTTVVALTDPFRKEYGPELAPILLLTDRGGKVLRRWTGYSPSLSATIVSEIKRLSSVPRFPET